MEGIKQRTTIKTTFSTNTSKYSCVLQNTTIYKVFSFVLAYLTTA